MSEVVNHFSRSCLVWLAMSVVQLSTSATQEQARVIPPFFKQKHPKSRSPQNQFLFRCGTRIGTRIGNLTESVNKSTEDVVRLITFGNQVHTVTASSSRLETTQLSLTSLSSQWKVQIRRGALYGSRFLLWTSRFARTSPWTRSSRPSSRKCYIITSLFHLTDGFSGLMCPAVEHIENSNPTTDTGTTTRLHLRHDNND